MLFILILAELVAISSIISSSRRKRTFVREIAERIEQDRHEWAAFPRVESLLNTYIEIVSLAGPNSRAAKEFRFSAEDDPLLGDEQNAALHIFNRTADIIDRTWCSTHKQTITEKE